MSQLLIKGGQCVNSTGVFGADVLVDEGKIVMLGKGLTSQAERTIDARGLLVLPGGVDVHVHLPWPTGATISSDDFSSGTKAAAFGGVTTLLDFVIPDAGEGLIAAVQRKLGDAQAHSWVDFGLHVNIRADVDEALSAIAGLVQEGFPSFKAFLAYEGFRLPDQELLRVMRAVTSAGGMITAHAEYGLLADQATEDLIAAGRISLADYPASRPRVCEISAIHRIITYARHYGTRLHIHHVTTAEGAALIAAARREGFPITGETCPQYLLLDERGYAGEARKAASYVCAPPIRAVADQAALWSALANDGLSAVATDHCPYLRRQKEAHLDDFRRVPGGMAGVETRLPLIFNAGVVGARLSLPRFVDVWSTGPARALGLYPRKGAIQVGADADFVLLDPNRKVELQASNLHMNTDCLPYEGWQVQGWPTATILRGLTIVENGVLSQNAPCGTFVPRKLEK